MDEKPREIIELERSFSIETQDTIYYYNEEFWNMIYIKKWFPFCHIISSNFKFNFMELPAPQANKVVFVFKEIRYFLVYSN